VSQIQYTHSRNINQSYNKKEKRKETGMKCSKILAIGNVCFWIQGCLLFLDSYYVSLSIIFFSHNGCISKRTIVETSVKLRLTYNFNFNGN
jgi:hypothetical protein